MNVVGLIGESAKPYRQWDVLGFSVTEMIICMLSGVVLGLPTGNGAGWHLWTTSVTTEC